MIFTIHTKFMSKFNSLQLIMNLYEYLIKTIRNSLLKLKHTILLLLAIKLRCYNCNLKKYRTIKFIKYKTLFLVLKICFVQSGRKPIIVQLQKIYYKYMIKNHHICFTFCFFRQEQIIKKRFLRSKYQEIRNNNIS